MSTFPTTPSETQTLYSVEQYDPINGEWYEVAVDVEDVARAREYAATTFDDAAAHDVSPNLVRVVTHTFETYVASAS